MKNRSKFKPSFSENLSNIKYNGSMDDGFVIVEKGSLH